MDLGKWLDIERHNVTRLSFIIFFFTLLLYANTLGHDYTQDDAIVITQNEFTLKGFEGIPSILSNDTFLGFFKSEEKLNLVSGGRYRPLSLVMFSIEIAIFGKNPFVGHLINILLYALLCVLLFRTLLFIFTSSDLSKNKNTLVKLSFLTALIYASHPIHTEVVANIKGRDEILCMIGSVSALLFTWKYLVNGKNSFLLLTFLSLFLGLMSKENAISFLAVIPLSIFLFKKDLLKKSIKPTIALFASALLFISIRGLIVKSSLGESPMELMNNPFLKYIDGGYVPFEFSEKAGTIIYTLGKYLQLLIFPHPLTHDYYPRQIPILQLGDPIVIISFLIITSLIILALIKNKNWPIFTFSIIYFGATLFLMSNILFPIGTNMNERFLFMPSLGFSLLLAWIIIKGDSTKFFKIGKTLLILLLILYSYKTISRNTVWKNDFTLFTTDVHTSNRSAKILNAAGGSLLTKSEEIKDPIEKKKLAIEAEEYLLQAIDIHPTYGNAHMLLGNAFYYQKKYEEAIASYEKTIEFQPDNQDAYNNLAIALRDAGRDAGENKGDLNKAEQFLNRSLAINRNDSETIRLMGVAKGVQGKHQEALEFFEILAKQNPENRGALENLVIAYRNVGLNEKASQVQQQLEKLK
jgi:Flp pilus assembly protein TadD